MKTKNKSAVLSLMIIGIMLFSLSTVLAENISRPTTSFFSDMRFSIAKNGFLFTAWGESNCCSTNPDDSLNLKNGNSVSCSNYCSYNKCAIDIWNYDALYLGTATPHSGDSATWSKEVTTGSYTSNRGSGTWDYVEIYCCPSSCESGSWDTDVYTCDSSTGGWRSRGSYSEEEYCSYDPSGADLCWCNEEDENFYVDINDGVHCQPSSYSSVSNGAWCPTPQCTSASQCGTAGYTGSNYCYLGNVAKNYRTYTCDGNKCSSHDENRIQENCANGCVNNACATAPACTDGQVTTSGCSNGATKTCFNGQWGNCAGGTPTGCTDSSIGGTCRLNGCQSGEGVVTGVCPGTAWSCCKSTGNGDGGTKESMTWSKFYSINEEDFSSQVSACSSTSECAPKEGYNVSCVVSNSDWEIYRERIQKSYVSQCTMSGLGSVIASLQRWVVGTSFCDILSSWRNNLNEFWRLHFTGNPGFCVAESSSWYGKIWDSALKMVGGLGIPYAYVLLATIGGILLIVVLIISKI